MININGSKLEEEMFVKIKKRVTAAQNSDAQKWGLMYYPLPMGFFNKIKFWCMRLKE